MGGGLGHQDAEGRKQGRSPGPHSQSFLVLHWLRAGTVTGAEQGRNPGASFMQKLFCFGFCHLFLWLCFFRMTQNQGLHPEL